MRRTLVGQSETKVVSREVLTKRHYFLKEQQERIKSKEFECLRSKADCSWTQENAELHRSRMRTIVHAADYFIHSMGCVSIEHYRTSRNIMSKQEHICI